MIGRPPRHDSQIDRANLFALANLAPSVSSAFSRHADETDNDSSRTHEIAMHIPIRLYVLAFAFLMTGSFNCARAQSCPLSVAQLKKLSVCELDRLFEQAPPGDIPVGTARGRVLLMTDARLPRLRACLASSVWKGKQFDCDGEFINQWPGFQALRGKAALGESWHDGKPCLVLDYPSDTPIFGNTRDELRLVAPGLYLARLYERCPCPHFRGYFVIEMACVSCP